MVFCNGHYRKSAVIIQSVTILILIDGFLQSKVNDIDNQIMNEVTILILIDGFLQCKYIRDYNGGKRSHNPYFNRWFSAIMITIDNIFVKYGHNPYFNRWFSAIQKTTKKC